MKNMTKQTQQGIPLTTRISRWWMAKSPARRKTLLTRGGLGTACFMAMAIGLPMLSQVSATQQDAYELRDRSERLAAAQDAGAVLRADESTPALLKHDWLRSVEYSLERDPGSALSRYAALERDRAALSSFATLEVGHMRQAENMVAQTQCLAKAIYYEARSERTAGQLGVAEVIMNRVGDHRYPNTICDVVYQGATRTTGCQFTFTCDGATDKAPRGKLWDKAQTIASHVVMGLNEEKTGGATHYHATYVNPVWNSGLVRTERIGLHIFYRFPRGQEWATASARQSSRLAKREAGLQALMPISAVEPAEAKVIKASAPALFKKPKRIAAVTVEDVATVEDAIVLGDVTEAPAAKILSDDELNAVMGKTSLIAQPEMNNTSTVTRTIRRIVDGVLVEEREVTEEEAFAS